MEPYTTGRRTGPKSYMWESGRVGQKGGRSVARSKKVAAARARPQVDPGRTRISGFYGRYAPLGGEKKFFDTVRAVHQPAVAGTISNLSLNLIPQGVTESERVGRKCTISKIMLRGNITTIAATAANATSNICRVIVYEDTQANGATAAVTDILESATEQSFNNLSNSMRFRILMDKRNPGYCPSGSGRGTTDTLAFGENVQDFFWSKSCAIPIEFSATTGAITEIRSNNIGVLTIVSSAITDISYVARVRFSDS